MICPALLSPNPIAPPTKPTRRLRSPWRKSATRIAAFIATIALGCPAHALQRLDAFLASAKQHNLDRREADLVAKQSQHDVRLAEFRLTPILAASGSYRLNQYEASAQLPTGPGEVRTVVIVPKNQFDATLELQQPIVDVGAWISVGAAKHDISASNERVRSTELEVSKNVSRAYFQLVAAEALVVAARKTQDAAVANHNLTEQRLRAGVGTDLDVKRAFAEVERTRQLLADAEYAVAVARRSLHTLTGLDPANGAPTLDSDLKAEAPLEHWVDGMLEDVPAIRAAKHDVASAEKHVKAAGAALIPTLAAVATQRFTNATGFLGKYAFAAVGASLSWRFDFAALPALRTQRGALAIAKVREQRVRQATYDQVHDAWHRVRAGLVKSTSARSQTDASKTAVERAKQRYENGTALLIDVTQAERDLFSAEVARIQADADLALARTLLRLASGHTLESTPDPKPVEVDK